MNFRPYNYFSSLPEWKNYNKGNWQGKGISMVLQNKEPYEKNIQTLVIWKEKKNKYSVSFYREQIKTKADWTEEDIIEIFADKIRISDHSKEWSFQIQAMTEDKFHLHVESLIQKNLILYSGIVERKKSLFQRALSVF
ncbi:hypothetical protein [Leptospira ilyithenensis]|uniref:Uncharacterized protein n=1 Tax=Leptospira ilyithenensis TaxID=2484901 RepID=A0A4V6QMS0_9LEPT|nr:hypothetical protein [Leptospira ilyithenensis]TGN08238.1 hypothetical protein EHS11_15070 [Leptospira ilyithenensis]